MVQSLFLIALASCYQQAGSITDVGSTPYHLILPVLKRLNSKQLAILEENSPELTPDTDEIWAALIEKDFSDRPLGNRHHMLNGTSSPMPNRDLYMQYLRDRERFLESSAERLRHHTQKLKREKSKNSIVPMQGFIAEPVIRRRALAVPRPMKPLCKYSNKSIMGKAMKDMQHRLLMFGGLKHDPYAAFQSNRVSVAKPKLAQCPVLPTSRSTSESHSNNNRTWSLPTGQGIYLVNVPPVNNSPTRQNNTSNSNNSTGHTIRSEVTSSSSIQESRKRKTPAPLLDTRRKHLRSRRPTHSLDRGLTPKRKSPDSQIREKSLVELSPYSKTIKSSIFH